MGGDTKAETELERLEEIIDKLDRKDIERKTVQRAHPYADDVRRILNEKYIHIQNEPTIHEVEAKLIAESMTKQGFIMTQEQVLRISARVSKGRAAKLLGMTRKWFMEEFYDRTKKKGGGNLYFTHSAKDHVSVFDILSFARVNKQMCESEFRVLYESLGLGDENYWKETKGTHFLNELEERLFGMSKLRVKVEAEKEKKDETVYNAADAVEKAEQAEETPPVRSISFIRRGGIIYDKDFLTYLQIAKVIEIAIPGFTERKLRFMLADEESSARKMMGGPEHCARVRRDYVAGYIQSNIRTPENRGIFERPVAEKMLAKIGYGLNEDNKAVEKNSR